MLSIHGDGMCVVCFRQCALTALNDVRQFLSVEGGHVAVSEMNRL